MSLLADYCAECGGRGAGPRQLCEACLPLYPLDETPVETAFIDVDQPLSTDECRCGCND
jgi:hypothetical protein